MFSQRSAEAIQVCEWWTLALDHSWLLWDHRIVMDSQVLIRNFEAVFINSSVKMNDGSKSKLDCRPSILIGYKFRFHAKVNKEYKDHR